MARPLGRDYRRLVRCRQRRVNVYLRHTLGSRRNRAIACRAASRECNALDISVQEARRLFVSVHFKCYVVKDTGLVYLHYSRTIHCLLKILEVNVRRLYSSLDRNHRSTLGVFPCRYRRSYIWWHHQSHGCERPTYIVGKAYFSSVMIEIFEGILPSIAVAIPGLRR